MTLTLKRVLLPGVVATSLVSATFLPMKPASADENVWRDAAIGAGVGAASSLITGHKPIPNIVNGAVSGAAVNQARDLHTPKGKRPGIVQDAAVGAAAGAATSAVINRRHIIRGTANGAATGAVINILTPKARRR